MTEKHFGEVLRQMREEKGISLRKFAVKIGITPTYLSKIERLEITKAPSEEFIRLAASELDTDFQELMILAGRIPAELPEIISQRPREMAILLRTAKKMNTSELKEFTDSLQRKIDKQKDK
jgi:transcriptional regulator with XRE-family HTH domain